MICEHCSTDTADDESVCRACGRRLRVPSSSRSRPDDSGPIVMFDQDASSPMNRSGVVATVLALLAILGAGLFLAFRPADDSPGTVLGEPGLDTISSSVPGDSVSPPPVTTATAPVSTALDTALAPSSSVTAEPTTIPPNTSPPTTVPPTTAAPTTAPPPTTPPPIWDVPPIPDSAPVDGPGSPQILAEVLGADIRAEAALPFLLRTQTLADAWAGGDFETAREIDLRFRAGPEYQDRYANLDRSSLMLVDAGIANNSYELLVIEVDLASDATLTHLDCAQYVSDGTTGNVVRRGGFELATYERNITPEELRNDADVIAGLTDRCTFAAMRPVLVG